jgi:hypothetical protein
METTFYDNSGHPVAYLSPENDNSIYIWDGHAVAYIIDELIYGWRGRHIGWFVKGVLYDLNVIKSGQSRKSVPILHLQNLLSSQSFQDLPDFQDMLQHHVHL